MATRIVVVSDTHCREWDEVHPDIRKEVAEADIAVLHRQKGDFQFRDCGWARIGGSERLECELTVRAGEVLWDRQGYTCPDWEDGGPEYFALPGTQAGAVARLWR